MPHRLPCILPHQHKFKKKCRSNKIPKSQTNIFDSASLKLDDKSFSKKKKKKNLMTNLKNINRKT